MQFHGDNAIDFNPNNLKLTKPKEKSVKTDNGTINYKVSYINYNQGTIEHPKTKALVIELPEVSCRGITQQYKHPTCGYILEVDDQDQSNMIDILKSIERFILNEILSKKDIYKKFARYQSADDLNEDINGILRYRKDDDGEVTDENPTVYTTVYVSGYDGPPKFIGIDGKRIRWGDLRNVRFRCVPTIKIADLYMSSTVNKIRVNFVKAIITDIDTDAAREAEIIEKYSANLGDFDKKISDLMMSSEKKQEESFQFTKEMINTQQTDNEQLQITLPQEQQNNQGQFNQSQGQQAQGKGQFGQPQSQQAQGQGQFGQPQVQGQFNQPQGQGQFNQPQGQGQFNQPQGQGQFNQPQGQFNQSQGQGQFKQGQFNTQFNEQGQPTELTSFLKQHEQ